MATEERFSPSELAVKLADEWMMNHRVSEPWRIMSALRDELVRAHSRVEPSEPDDQMRTRAESAEALIDELEEKLSSLRAGCLDLSRDELIQQITAVGEREWERGVWLTAKTAPLQERIDELTEQNQRFATRLAGYARAVQVQLDPVFQLLGAINAVMDPEWVPDLPPSTEWSLDAERVRVARALLRRDEGL